MVYIATTDNEAYVGPAPMETIAQQIYETYGKKISMMTIWIKVITVLTKQTFYRTFWMEC